MFYSKTSLKHKIIKLIKNNPINHRNTDIINPYFSLSITFFYKRYKAVVIEDLYEQGLINLHGDVDLFILSEKLVDTKYLNISASLTQKGIAYYRLHIQKLQVAQEPVMLEQPLRRGTLSIVR